jgi:hypothetical protein
MVYPAVLILALAIVGRIHAAPTTALPPPYASSLVESSSALSACGDINDCRTMWGIIYSCVITIFACTYLSFHPDVPDPRYTPWRIFALRICSVLIGFLIPEFVVAKAAWQWLEVAQDKTKFQFQGMVRNAYDLP